MMGKIRFWGFGALSSLLLAAGGCGDSDLVTRTEQGTGRMAVLADLNTSVISSRQSQSRGNAAAVDASALNLVLTSVDGQNVYELGTLGEYDGNQTFPVGNYYLEAAYGDEYTEGFDSPYFYGKSDVVRIADGETTQVGVSASLGNSMFVITYTEALRKYLTDYSAEIVSSGSTTPVVYDAAETRPAYVRSGDVDIFVNVTKPSGASARLLAATVSAEPRHCYTVTVDMNDGEVGEGAISISFDDNLLTEDVNIDLSDELMNAPAPNIVLTGAETIDYVETTRNTAPVKYNVVAKGAIAKVTLNTSNAAAVSDRWPESIDLMRADEATRQSLADLGLKALGLWQNPDKMAVVDLTDVVSNITDNGSPVAFSLTVVDRMGKTNEQDRVVTVNVKPIEFSVSEIGDLLIGNTSLKFMLSYNGDNPADVVYYYKNERGTTSQASVASITPADPGKYEVVLNVPLEGDFIFYASNGKIKTPEYKAPRIASRTYKAEAVNVFATSALIAVTETEAPDAGKSYAEFATLFLSTDGTSYTKTAGAVTDQGLKVSGLTAGTLYYAKVSLSGSVDDARALEFTTEDAAQIPGADMDSWTEEGGNAYWSLAIPASPWATLNPLTTSDPGSNGYAWNATSGTKPTDDAVSGKAAYIATVGWGASNQPNTGYFLPTLHCSNVTIGELYTGTYNSADAAPAYGVDFTSRPASLSFSYKYTAKNSGDRGTAEITVLDAEGNILATASAELSAASAYTAKTLALDYTSAVKAASLKVVFRSSKGGYTSVSTSNLNYPERNSRNYTDRYYGSELYIDNVKLNY